MTQAPRTTPAEQPIGKRLGVRIRLLRVERGWSQETLAEIAGLHRNYIGHVERGELNISVSQLVKIALAFGVRPGILLDDTEHGTAGPLAETRHILGMRQGGTVRRASRLAGSYRKTR